MSKYEDSIKCKYCGHFEPNVNRCHLYHDYDQSLSKGGGDYFKETSPNSRCSHFRLPSMEVIIEDVSAKDGCKTNRSDGTAIVDLDDDPQLKQQLQAEESRHSSRRYHVDSDFVAAVFGWMVLVGILFGIIGFIITLSGTGHGFFSAIILDFGELFLAVLKWFVIGAVCTLLIALYTNHRNKK